MAETTTKTASEAKKVEDAKKVLDVANNTIFTQTYYKTISEAYHKAKADGSNPELVKAVEDLLSKPKETTPTPQTGKGDGGVKKQIEGGLSVIKKYLVLADGPARFPQNFTCFAVLENLLLLDNCLQLQDYHPYRDWETDRKSVV